MTLQKINFVQLVVVTVVIIDSCSSTNCGIRTSPTENVNGGNKTEKGEAPW